MRYGYTDADIDKMDDAERVREYHDAIRAGVPNGPEPVAGFTTAKGSTLRGACRRHHDAPKAARPEHLIRGMNAASASLRVAVPFQCFTVGD